MHPVVPLVQVLAKHIEKLVALPDELRATTLKKYRKLRLCDSCGCHNERELADCGAHFLFNAFWKDYHFCVHRMLTLIHQILGVIIRPIMAILRKYWN